MFSGSPYEPLSNPHARKRALVTGGAKRVGRELALSLARAGMDVAITFRESSAEAADTALAIQALGIRSVALEMDVRSEASVRSAVAATIEAFGGIDLLVNNAAIFEAVSLADITVD